MTRGLHLASIAALLTAIAAPAQAGGFNLYYTALDVPFADAAPGSTVLDGINTAGVLAGFFSDRQGGTHGFVDVGGVFTQVDVHGKGLGDPQPGTTAILGINDKDEIVGSYLDKQGEQRGFVADGSVGKKDQFNAANFTKIDAGADGAARAEGINDKGEIVGFFATGTGKLHGFTNDGGASQRFDVDGTKPKAAGGTTQGFGINGAGHIVGSFASGKGDQFGFLKIGATFLTIDITPSVLGNAAPGTTQAFGINDGDEIVGTFGDAGSGQHGFLDIGGDVTGLDVPFAGAFDTEATGINDKRQIVGTFRDASGLHGFVLAVPEPFSLAVFATGLLAIVKLRRRG